MNAVLRGAKYFECKKKFTENRTLNSMNAMNVTRSLVKVVKTDVNTIYRGAKDFECKES